MDTLTQYYRDLDDIAEEVYTVRGEVFADPGKIHFLLLRMGLVLHRKHALIVYEDQLPVDISDTDYKAWYERSWLYHGVRVGPKIDTRRANEDSN